MPNRTSMAKINSIETLHRSGHSNREIARLLAIDRGTVNKYVQQLKGADENRPNPRTGSQEIADSENRPIPQNESDVSPAQMGVLAEKLSHVEAPSLNGPKSQCDPYREIIEKKLDQGLSMTRFHQDLKSEHGFAGSYHCVRRFVNRLGAKRPLPFRRMETEPGEEAQIDFGTAAPVIMPDGKTRRPWMFRIVLSCSRKAYSEVIW